MTSTCYVFKIKQYSFNLGQAAKYSAISRLSVFKNSFSAIRLNHIQALANPRINLFLSDYSMIFYISNHITSLSVSKSLCMIFRARNFYGGILFICEYI